MLVFMLELTAPEQFGGFFEVAETSEIFETLDVSSILDVPGSMRQGPDVAASGGVREHSFRG